MNQKIGKRQIWLCVFIFLTLLLISCQLFEIMAVFKKPLYKDGPEPVSVTSTPKAKEPESVSVTSSPVVKAPQPVSITITPIETIPEPVPYSGTCPQNSNKIVFAILYYDSAGRPDFEMKTINPDGSDESTILWWDTWVGHPGWSPERCRIVYEVGKVGYVDDLYIFDLISMETIQLTDDKFFDQNPSWSPDGNLIAYWSEHDGGEGDIYVIDINDKGIIQLTTHEAEDQQPAWSPSGDKIAFSSRRDGNWEIYLMNPDGSGLSNLTNNEWQDNRPTWSPDGKKIAFFSNRSSWVEIHIMDADGSNVFQLSNMIQSLWVNSGNDMAWSPDGQSIVFIAGTQDTNSKVFEDLFLIDVQNGEITRMNKDLENAHNPNW